MRQFEAIFVDTPAVAGCSATLNLLVASVLLAANQMRTTKWVTGGILSRHLTLGKTA